MSNLSEEEKKAIDILKEFKDSKPFIIRYNDEPYNKAEIIEIVLNLIEKLKLELENHKNLIQHQQTYCHQLEEDLFVGCNNLVIHKDKIREKIKYYKQKRDIDRDNHFYYDCYIVELEELLEE